MIESLRKIYADELKLPTLQDEDDFFDVGGHSLIMARIQSRIELELGLSVAMDTLFRHTTVGALASRLKTAAVSN